MTTHKEIYELYKQHKKYEKRYSKQEEGVFNIFDDITEQTGREFMQFMESNPQKVHLRINSYGGDVKTGLMIYNTLKTVPEVSTENVGFAASMGADLLMAGHTRSAHSMSLTLLHRTRTMAYGEQNDILKTYNQLKTIDDMFMRELYLPKLNMQQEDIEKMLIADEFMDANQALKRNVVGKLIDSEDEDFSFVAKVTMKDVIKDMEKIGEEIKKVPDLSLTLEVPSGMLLTEKENEMLEYIKGER